MATPIGFERWEPGNPWGDVVFDDGSRQSVPDPDGSIEREAREMGARLSAQPDLATPAPEAPVQAPLTGAASQLATSPPDAPPEAAEDSPPENIPPPPPPPAPPPALAAQLAGASPALPSGAPPSPAETAAIQASPDELAALQGPPAGTPSTTQSAAADVMALHGVTPPAAAPAAAPVAPGGATPAAEAAAPAAPAPGLPPAPETGAGLSQAEQSIRSLAPHLLPASASVSSVGPDAESAESIRDVAGQALLQRGQAINETVSANRQNYEDQAARANQDYFDSWRARNQQMGDFGALTTARDQVAAKLATAKQTPVKPHQDFPEWFVAMSIFGAAAGGLAQGLSNGAVRNSTLDMLNDVVTRWVDTQKYNKSMLVSSLEEQLGDKNAAIMLARGKIKDSLATQADAQARFARTTEGMRVLGATAATLRAQALEDYNKTQAVLMGKVSTGIKLAAPAAGAAPKLDNAVTRELATYGVTPKAYADGLEKKVGAGETSPTLNQAIDRVSQIDGDAAALHSLAATNGGKLAGKGLINVPKAFVPVLARMGIKQGMDGEQVRQIYVDYMVKAAKAMGSRVTEKELEIAGESLGSTTAGFFRMMKRIRDETNEAVKSTAEMVWPGASQQVLNLHRKATSATQGIPSIGAEPFEAENAPETGPPARKTPDQEQAETTDAAYLASLTPEQRDAELANRNKKTAPVVPASKSIGAQRPRDFPASKF